MPQSMSETSWKLRKPMFSLALGASLFTSACLDDDVVEPPPATPPGAQEFPDELGEDSHMLDLAQAHPRVRGFFFRAGH